MADPKIKFEIGAEIKGLQSGVDQAEKELSQLGKAADAVSPKIDKATKSASNFNSVGTDFARIIQDAPFGIIGVSNNITQLASSFGNASSSGASFTQILKGAFSGGNLLSIAISAITTGLVLYEQGLFGAKEGVEDLDQAQNDFNDSLKETDKLIRAQFYTEILRDLGILEIQVTETGRVIKDVFSDKTAEERLALLANRIKTATKPELEALATFLKENVQDSLRGAANATTNLEKEIAKSNVDLYSQQLKLVDEQLAFYKDSTDKAKKSTKEFTESIDENITRVELRNKLIEESSSKLEKLLTVNKQAFKDFNFQLPENTPIDDAVSEADQKVIDGLSKIRARLSDFNAEATNILNQGIAMGLGDLAFAIGESLASGGNVLESAGAVLLSSVAGILGQLGQLAISAGVTMLALKVSFETLGGAGAIIAGTALVALAGAVSSKAKKLGSGFGRGGGGSFSGASGVTGGNSFAGAGQGLQFDRSLNLVGEFRVKGQDLVYVFNEASSRNQRG